MTTFVTSYINYYKTPIESSTHFLRLSRFNPLLTSKLNLCIFVTPDCVEIIHQYLKTHCPNFESHIKIIVLKSSFFESSYMYLTTLQASPQKLPEIRFPPKDNFDFLCYTHSKIEFLRQSKTINPFQSTHFAWIDYDICNMFQNKTSSVSFLEMISKNAITNTQIPPTEHEPPQPIDTKNQVYIPGCWSTSISKEYTNTIHWRFCGCFMLCHADAIDFLWTLYETHFVEFLRTYDTLVWDINFLAWLEHKQYWNPLWYAADHNDSIVQIPAFAFSEKIHTLTTNTEVYNYPDIDDFLPSSASICFDPYNERFVMNTRYVNYEYLPSGHCNIYDANRNVYTKNVCCFLDNSFQIDSEKGFHVMEELEKNMKLTKANDHQMFHGVEDIRLFYNSADPDQIKFIATTVNYSPCGKNRMMIGYYDTDTFALKNCALVDPPTDTPCEKNWIPFHSVKEPKKEYFIYRWSNTFQIGEHNEYIDKNENEHEFTIAHECKLKNPIFDKYEVRGSSNFTWTTKGYIGVVHFSVEHTLPKQYYHMLVLLDLDTYLPKYHSRVFYFHEFGVEFCLTMQIVNRSYLFWISRRDREPIRMDVPMTKLPFDFKIETTIV